MNPEEKKVREAAKTEQWETERKKTAKNIIPKCYFTTEYWNPRDTLRETAKDIKHITQLERLKVRFFC